MHTNARPLFADRHDAGRKLASRLSPVAACHDAVILALPRGGVPVAAEVARAFRRPFDVLVVRKLGIPGREEVAMGAIAGDGTIVLDADLLRRLRLDPAQVDRAIARETAELERRQGHYQGRRPEPEVRGRTVVLVDDGLATGSTMRAAVKLLRRRRPARIIVAVPVAPPEVVERLELEADEVVVLAEPEPFVAVGRWYEDFGQILDEEVLRLLALGEEQAKCPQLDPTPTGIARGAGLGPLRRASHPLTGDLGDYDRLLERIGEAEIVLLGEASHGTHEFYHQRARLTRHLVLDKGFTAVAAEADWPDAYRIHRFVNGRGEDLAASGALSDFHRFPSWMWRNTDMVAFVDWLRAHNAEAGEEAAVGFYGLDLYSMHKSMNEVLRYLERRAPEQAARARNRYDCINRFGPDPQNYGLLAGSTLSARCHGEVTRQLAELRAMEVELLRQDGWPARDEFFFAEQNARLVRNAEAYYRTMFRSDVSSWNVRDHHMMETLIELFAHLRNRNARAKVVVWAHNSHLGDARATERSARGECNLGQLVRQAFPGRCRLIGYSTWSGTVTAASGWHLPAERKRVTPALEESYEHLFHRSGLPAFWLDLHDAELAAALEAPRLQRAIGVVYHPETERQSHYFKVCLPRQFDAILHFDRTRAVEPLDRSERWRADEAPETFPAGL